MDANQKETINLENNPDYMTDGFGNYWQIVCQKCGQRTMQVVRPGKVQCAECG